MNSCRCPYCGKRISYFTALSIRRRGEYYCKRCKKESNKEQLQRGKVFYVDNGEIRETEWNICILVKILLSKSIISSVSSIWIPARSASIPEIFCAYVKRRTRSSTSALSCRNLIFSMTSAENIPSISRRWIPLLCSSVWRSRKSGWGCHTISLS